MHRQLGARGHLGRASLGGAVVVALTLMSLTSALAVEDGLVDDAIRFRRSVGLEADRAFVESTFAKEGYPDDAYGVPLSKAEVATIDDRQARLGKATSGHEWAHEQPGYAGSWVDQSKDGLIVYQFSKNVNAAELELDRLLPAGVAYEVRRVDRSLTELRELQARITKDIDTLAKEGIEVLSIGLDISDDTVTVGIAGDAAGKRATVKARYGDFVKVATEDPGQADCSGLRDCPPLKGGIRIYDVPGPGDCTAVYIAKKPNERFVLVTAGHCIKLDAQGNNWKHLSSDPVQGTSDYNNSVWCCTDANDEGADVGFFLIDTGQEPGSKTKAIVSNSSATVDKIRADLPDYSPYQQEGAVVCRMGHGSIDQDDGYSGYTAKKCGVIDQVEVEKKSTVTGYSTRWVDDLNVWEGDSTGGDSGGIVFANVPGQGDEIHLLGTHVHSSTDNPGADGYSWYEPVAEGIWEILDKKDLLLDPCTLDDPC